MSEPGVRLRFHERPNPTGPTLRQWASPRWCAIQSLSGHTPHAEQTLAGLLPDCRRGRAIPLAGHRRPGRVPRHGRQPVRHGAGVGRGEDDVGAGAYGRVEVRHGCRAREARIHDDQLRLVMGFRLRDPFEPARVGLGGIAAHDQYYVRVLDVDPMVRHRSTVIVGGGAGFQVGSVCHGREGYRECVERSVFLSIGPMSGNVRAGGPAPWIIGKNPRLVLPNTLNLNYEPRQFSPCLLTRPEFG